MLCSPELGSITLTLPLVNVILIIEYKVEESCSDSCVSLLPGCIRILLELKYLETIEIDGIEGLIFPFILKDGLC